MIEQQDFISIEVSALIEKVKEMYFGKYRLVQIGCTRCQDGLEINYSFDREYHPPSSGLRRDVAIMSTGFHFVNLRIRVPLAQAVIPSVSGIYWCALLYENEMQDLFGVTVEGIVLDYKGTFYRTAVKWPFNQASEKSEGV